MTPTRIQRKRTKGWRMPENTVYVGRPTIWMNPFRVVDGHRIEAVGKFLNMMTAGGHSFFRGPRLMFVNKPLIRQHLRGKHLACWCPLDEPCHADVLLTIANGKA